MRGDGEQAIRTDNEARAQTGSPPSANAAPAAAADAGQVIRYRAQDGLLLAARIFTPDRPAGLPVLCLPGLSRNSRDFAALGLFFSRHVEEPRHVVALDYRGRGLSEADPDWRKYTPSQEANDVLAGAAALGIESAIVVGTSRGGLIAMLIGALRPGLLAGVVLNDIGPVIEPAGLARIKAYLSERSTVRTWEEAAAAVRAATGDRFPALSGEDWLAFAQATFRRGDDGPLQPDFAPNLLRSVEALDPSAGLPPLWPQFEALARVPVLAIRGEHSDLFSAETMAEMARRHPDLEQLTVPGQGHAPLLRDAPTLERIRAFARRCEAARG